MLDDDFEKIIDMSGSIPNGHIIEKEFVSQFAEKFSQFIGCGCTPKSTMRQDCYFYSEDMDMGAIIKCCSFHGGYGYCPCGECDKFISKSEAYNIIRKHADER